MSMSDTMFDGVQRIIEDLTWFECHHYTYEYQDDDYQLVFEQLAPLMCIGKCFDAGVDPHEIVAEGNFDPDMSDIQDRFFESLKERQEDKEFATKKAAYDRNSGVTKAKSIIGLCHDDPKIRDLMTEIIDHGTWLLKERNKKAR